MELIATEGHWLTQKVLKDGERRLFFRIIYLAISLTENDFEEWSDEQKTVYEEEHKDDDILDEISDSEALDIITGKI